MKSQKSIELLNKAVADELQTVHQYMYWHFHLDDQGFGPLASLLRRIAIVEMTHIERIAERILFLKGEVEMLAAGGVEKITEPDAILTRGPPWSAVRSRCTTSLLWNAARTLTLPQSNSSRP